MGGGGGGGNDGSWFQRAIGFSLLKLDFSFLRSAQSFLEAVMCWWRSWKGDLCTTTAGFLSNNCWTLSPSDNSRPALFFRRLLYRLRDIGRTGCCGLDRCYFPPFVFLRCGTQPYCSRLRQSPWTSAFLDAVNVSSVALMLAVIVKLGQTTLTGSLHG